MESPRALAAHLPTRKPPVPSTHLSFTKFWLLPNSDSFPFTVSQLCPIPCTIFVQSQSCSKETQNMVKTNSQTDLEKNKQGLRAAEPGGGREGEPVRALPWTLGQQELRGEDGACGWMDVLAVTSVPLFSQGHLLASICQHHTGRGRESLKHLRPRLTKNRSSHHDPLQPSSFWQPRLQTSCNGARPKRCSQESLYGLPAGLSCSRCFSGTGPGASPPPGP